MTSKKNGLSLSNYVKYTDRKKKVGLINSDGTLLQTYNSTHEVGTINGISYKALCRVCSGERPHTHGLIFKYI